MYGEGRSEISKRSIIPAYRPFPSSTAVPVPGRMVLHGNWGEQEVRRESLFSLHAFQREVSYHSDVLNDIHSKLHNIKAMLSTMLTKGLRTQHTDHGIPKKWRKKRATKKVGDLVKYADGMKGTVSHVERYIPEEAWTQPIMFTTKETFRYIQAGRTSQHRRRTDSLRNLELTE